MRKEATLQEWKELYEIGLKIKDLRPWEYFYDIDIITVVLPNDEHMYYCSIMGRGGECFGVGTYMDDKGMDGFFNILEEPDMPITQILRYQNGLFSYFGDRNELTQKDLSIIKSLGYKFRGKNQWLYFQSYKPPYSPYILNKDEVRTLTDVYIQLYEAICDYVNKNIKVDFKNQNTLLRIYENTSWITKATPLTIPDMRYFHPLLNDDLLAAKLNKQPQTGKVLEIDIAYLNGTVRDKSYERPAIPRIAIVTDAQSGIIFGQDMPRPEDKDAPYFLQLLIDFIINHGKPRVVYVRDVYCAHMIADLCEKLNIDLKISSRLDSIDTFVDMFNERDI
jgi:hypothetical protein